MTIILMNQPFLFSKTWELHPLTLIVACQGLGKTTLIQMLILQIIQQIYCVVVITKSNNIDSIKKITLG